MGEAFFWWTGEGFGLRVAVIMVPVGLLCHGGLDVVDAILCTYRARRFQEGEM